MKNFTKQNFKTNPLWIRLLIMAFMLLAGSSSAWGASLNTNTGDNRASGVEVQYNSTSKWYRIGSVSNMWNNGCTPKMSGSQNNPLDSHNFGTVTTLKLKGGEVNTRLNDCNSGCNDYAEARYSYKIYKINASEPSSYTTGFTANTWECGSRWDNASDVSIYNSANIDLLSGLGAGDYNLKMKMEIQARWSGGTYGNTWTHTASATFTIPGYSTTTGDKDFGDVDVNSSSDYTIELTHYGSDNTATVSITGTNKSEFTATVTESRDNTQILKVTFKPTSVDQDKTATITVTDAYNKTYTLNVTGTGKQACSAPTSVSVTGSETPCVGANETYTADIVGGSKYDLEWAVPDGYTIIEGQGTTSIIVEVGTTSGNITCTATCGNEAPSGEISVAPYTTIAPIISLSTEYVCPGESATITVESPELNVEGLSYKLYNKNDTSTPIAIITEPKTEPVAFTIQEGTYYVTVSHTCGGEKKSINEKTLLEYPAPEIPAYTLTNATRCKDVPSSDGSIVLKNPIGGISYQLDKVGSTTGWSSLAAGTHKLSATVNACPSLTEEWDIEVGEEDITPSATVTISGESSFCEGDNTELTCEVETTGEVTAYQWYNGDNLIQGAINSTYSARAEGNYKVVVTVLNSTCQDEFWSDEKVVTINPKPNEPVLSIPSPICAGSNFTLPEEDNNQRNITWNVNDRELTNLTAGTHNYTAKIIDVNGCESNEVTYTITVTALPEIISISQDIQEPVFYEDVTLTATATDGATVKWYEGGVEKATGTTYVVTSSSDASKTVTAKAFLNGCESAAETKTVKFSEEVCGTQEVTDDSKIEIWCKSSKSNLYLHLWYENGDKDEKITDWPGTTVTKDSEGYYKWTYTDLTSGKEIGYIFHVKDDDTNKTPDKTMVFEKGKRYKFTFNGGTDAATTYTPEDITKEVLAITAPAVKTVSFETTPGDGNINFSGQIVKTGCDNSLTYGFEYKEVGAANWTQVVLGRDLDKDAGFTFSDNTIKDLDGKYVVRAFITNDNSTQYGAEITNDLSTTQAPVTKATIQRTESDGTPVANDKKYCVGETAYIMVESDVKYTEISWKSQQGVDIVQTRFMNMYQFVVKGNDNIVVLLSNKYNVTPAESNTIEIYTFADPVLPTVSLNKVSICSNDEVGATVKLTNVAKGQTYQLYQQIDNGNGNFTEQAIGDAKTQEDEVTDKTELVLHTLTNTAATGKYFVKTYTEQCTKNLAATQPFTFTVVDAAEVFISIDPASAETTPWMPAKFTVNASDKYTLNVTKGNPAEAATEAEVSQNGNNVSVKIPLPQGSTLPEGTTGVYGQYENVVFPQDATTQYTITATLSATGGDDNPCAAPANATITLVPYVEECTIGH